MATTLSEGLKGFQGDTSEVPQPSASYLKGEWNIGITYNAGDQVTYNGSGYVAKIQTTGVTPEVSLNPDQVNTGTWQQIARRGSTGNAAVSYSTTTASFVQPAVNNLTGYITLDVDPAWAAIGSTVYMESGGYYIVSAKLPNSIRLQNLGYDNAAPGVTVATGKLLTAAGFRGVSGNSVPTVNAFSATTAAFTQPAVGSNVNVITTSTSWMAVSQIVFIGQGSSSTAWSTYYRVAAIVNASTVTLTNLGYEGTNATGAITAASGHSVSPGGVRGTPSSPAFSYVNSINWIVPPVGSIVTLEIGAVAADNLWMAAGAIVFIAGTSASVITGYYQVVTTTSGSKNVDLRNLGYAGNAAPGSTISVSQPKITPAGASGDPSFTVLTASFVQPAVNANVSISVGSTTWIAVGQILYIRNGGYYSVVSITSQSVFVATNLGYSANANTGTTVSSSSPVTSAGERGQNSTSFGTISPGFGAPAIGSNVTVTCDRTDWMITNMVVFIEGGGYYQIASIPTSTTVTLTNLGYAGNVTGSIASGVKIGSAGVRGLGASTTTTVNFTQPAVNSTVVVAVENTQWMAVGQALFVSTGGYYSVSSIASLTSVTLINLGYTGNTTPASSITSGARVSSGGIQGIAGLSSVTALTSSFTQPAVNSTVVAAMGSSNWLSVGQVVFVQGGGYYLVSALPSVTSATLQNLGYTGNLAVSSSVSSGAIVSAGGLQGSVGFSTFTTLTSAFTQPATGSTVAAAVVSSLWMAIGQVIFVQGGGYYQVTALPTTASVTLQNLGYLGNANSGASVATSSAVSAGGFQGATGFNAYTTLTSAFTQPAVNSTVVAAVSNSSWMFVGQNVFVQVGGYYQVSSISSTTSVTLQNLGYPGNANPASSVTTGGGVSSGGLQGSAGANGVSSFTTTSSSYSQPAVSSTVVVSVGNSSWTAIGQVLFVQGGGYYQVTAIPSGTSVTLQNLGYTGNANPSATVSTAATVTSGGIQGSSGASTFTSLTAAFTQPAIGSTVVAAVGLSTWMAIGQVIFVQNGGYYQVTALPSSTSVTLQNLGYAGNANQSASVATSSAVSAGGFQGATGFSAYTTLTSAFTQPAIGSTVIAAIASSGWITVGQILFIATGGYYQVTAVPSSTSVTIQNLGFPGNQAPASSVPTAGGVSSGGARGAVGSNTYTVTTASFTQPAVSSPVSISVGTSDWMAIGQVIFVQGGGYYTVASTATSTTCSIVNLGYTGNATPAATVSSAADVSPAGITGVDGIRGFGIPYQFDTSTAITPATGKLRFNNATVASVTSIYLHETDRNGTAISNILDRIPNGSPLQIALENTPSVYAYYTLNAQTDNGTDRTLSVTYLSGGGTFTNNGNISLSFGITGPTGAAGGPIGIVHTFDTTLTATPAVGRLRFNNATVSSVTQIYVNETDRNNADISAVLALITNGSAIEVSKENSTTYGYFSLINQVDNGSDRTLNVTYLGGNGTFANNDNVVLAPFIKGTTGSGPGFFPVTIDVDPRIMSPRVTGGATAFASAGALTTGRADYRGLAFSGSSDQFAQFDIFMPGNYNGGTVTAQFYWVQTTAGAGDIQWAISAIAFAADETMDQAFGTQVTVTDTFIATYRIHISSATSAVTIANSPTAAKWVTFQVGRLGAQAPDTSTGSVILTKVTLTYTSI